MFKLWIRILNIFLMLLIPLVIVLGVVRLVATEPYLEFEYSKFDFPEDAFGFDRDQRQTHAVSNIHFITQNQPLSELSTQKHNNSPLYNARELSHMQDVQNVYRSVWQIWQIAFVLSVLCGLALAWRKENRPVFYFALRTGSLLTMGIVLAIGLLAIVAWQTWFVIFHQIFFVVGSWTFDFSDTLIRLFPEKFWYDAALTISSLSLIAGFLVFLLGTRLLKTTWNSNLM